MDNNERRLEIAIRKRVVLISLLLMTIVACFALIIYQTNRNDYDGGLLIDTFGKQRMLTQMMAKDANRIYALQQALETGNNVDPENTIKEKVASSKHQLELSRNSFKTVVNSLHTGTITIAGRDINFQDSQKEIFLHLKDLDGIWDDFDKCISVVINTGTINREIADAVIYINNKNEKLMEESDSITKVILEGIKERATLSTIAAAGLVAVSFIVMLIILLSLYKYIIIPMNELYRGITETGISKYSYNNKIPTKKELTSVIQDIEEAFDKLRKLITLIENVNSSMSFNEVLEYIYKTFSSFIPYSYIGIALAGDQGKTLEASYGISDGRVQGLPHGLLGIKVDIAQTSLGNIIDTGKARIINDYEKYVEGREIKEYTSVIINAGIKSSITLPLKINKKQLGMIFFSSIEKGVYRDEHIEFLKALANSISISFEKSIFVDNLLYSSIHALAKLAEARDIDTGDHLERMKAYTKLIAVILSEKPEYQDVISPQFIFDMERFSPMHDIGKVGIRDSILLKPGKLTPEEFEEMKYHAVYGANVLKAAEDNMAKSGRSLFNMGIEIAGSHHERWDGTGYPKGLKGEEIHLSARIVAVADVFDALTSKRPYKEPFSFEESAEIIVQGRGKHFDPAIVEVFVKNQDRFKELYLSFGNKESSAVDM